MAFMCCFFSLGGSHARFTAPGQYLVVMIAIERVKLNVIGRVVAVDVALGFCVEVLRALVASL